MKSSGIVVITRRQLFMFHGIVLILLLLAAIGSAHLWGEYRYRNARLQYLQESATLQLQLNNVPYCWVYGEVRQVEYAGKGNWKVVRSR